MQVDLPDSIKVVVVDPEPCGRFVTITFKDVYEFTTFWYGPINPSTVVINVLAHLHVGISSCLTRRN